MVSCGFGLSKPQLFCCDGHYRLGKEGMTPATASRLEQSDTPIKKYSLKKMCPFMGDRKSNLSEKLSVCLEKPASSLFAALLLCMWLRQRPCLFLLFTAHRYKENALYTQKTNCKKYYDTNFSIFFLYKEIKMGFIKQILTIFFTRNCQPNTVKKVLKILKKS